MIIYESCKISDINNYAKLGTAFRQTQGVTKEDLKENIDYVRNEMVRWYDSIAWVDDASHPNLKRTLTIPGSLEMVTVPHPVVSQCRWANFSSSVFQTLSHQVG